MENEEGVFRLKEASIYLPEFEFNPTYAEALKPSEEKEKYLCSFSTIPRLNCETPKELQLSSEHGTGPFSLGLIK